MRVHLRCKRRGGSEKKSAEDEEEIVAEPRRSLKRRTKRRDDGSTSESFTLTACVQTFFVYEVAFYLPFCHEKYFLSSLSPLDIRGRTCSP